MYEGQAPSVFFSKPEAPAGQKIEPEMTEAMPVTQTKSSEEKEKRKLATSFRKDLAAKLRASKERAQQEAVKVGVARIPIGKRMEPPADNEVKILSAGPILRGRLSQVFFTINEFKIHGQSSNVGQTTFDAFWHSLETAVTCNDFQQRMEDHRQHLWRVWLVQASTVTTAKSENKHVNRYEFLNLWRRVCAIGGWFWQDFPPELKKLYQCFDFGTKEKLKSDAASLCLELKSFWKAHT